MKHNQSLLGLQAYGDVDIVIKAILQRAKQIEKHELSEKEIIACRQNGENAVLIPGRGQLNTITAGEALGVDDVGARKGVDFIMASSSGAAVGYYWIAGLRQAADIFYKRNVDNKLISFLRNPILDIGSLQKEMKDRYPVDAKIFQDKTNPRLIIPVTSWEKGTNFFYEAGNVKDPLALVIASTLLPLVSGFPKPKPQITIEDTIVVDGLMNPTLISDAIKKGAKNILLLTINPLDYRIPYAPILIRFCDFLARHGIIAGAVNEMMHYPEILDHEFNQLKKYLSKEVLLPKGISLMVIAPTKVPMHSGSMNRDVLYKTQIEAELFTKELFTSYM